MNGMPQLPMSQSEQARDYARKMAVYSGDYKFIHLKLLNHRYPRVIGIDYVNVTDYIDEGEGNLLKFHLEIKSGAMMFEFNPARSGYCYDMVDTEHNRRFLASHFHLGFWLIEDAAIREEIEKMSVAIAEEIIRHPPAKTEIDPVFKKMEQPNLYDEEEKEVTRAPAKVSHHAKKKGGRPKKVMNCAAPAAAAKAVAPTVPMPGEVAGIQSPMIIIKERQGVLTP